MSAFVDTNVLIYAADRAAPTPRKTQIARELLLQPKLHISVQVLNEFTVNARHPKKLNLSLKDEVRWIETWLQLTVHSLTIDCFLKARHLQGNYMLSHWDSMILAAAEIAGCQTLYSEDLNTGQQYGGVKVVNPFAKC
ncbi:MULTISPECIES: PIN domain-containing protein [unclassified Lentimonas]|uniref:PIN domain-containing protein n=1 Tax=unclassified Lentimonas TaxID=2630993 RepID=UPI00132BB75C|nr:MULTISPECIES: PIN domain-containing protein [unclassified Lentimonas]CAA6690295.1 Programmed cell death toxin MazF like [Lentimonas sp. CC10]CAA6697703.1 Programmed cell death toxin MazF like [Lentimonas sp. CC19]CAA7069060.1 Programmed cell death toxin MazF like [Lentimonas sp. CC11]